MTPAANLAEPIPPPDPNQDRATTRATRLLGLLHKLIDFGKQLAAAAQQRPTGEALILLAMRFGTKSTALMLASIARGLRLAAALEERLGGPPARLNPAHAAADALCPHKPRAARPEFPADERRAKLPTSAKIAAWFRADPIETVLLHICNELGLTPDDPLWQEVNDFLLEHYDDLIQKTRNAQKQVTENIRSLPPDRSLPPATPPIPTAPLWQPAPHLVSVATTATGPP